MADTFSEFNASTHPIVKLEDDWNNALVHGLDKGFSYLVRKNGDYYEAINGKTGKLTYGGSGNVGGKSGTDANAVIQAAVDNMEKGVIVLKGDFSTDTGITFTPLIQTGTIEVLGYGASLTYTGAGTAITILQNNDAVDMYEWKNVDIKGLRIIGTSAAQIGLLIRASNCLFKDLMFDEFSTGEAIELFDSYPDFAEHNSFENISIRDSKYGLAFRAGVDNTSFVHTKIDHLTIGMNILNSIAIIVPWMTKVNLHSSKFDNICISVNAQNAIAAFGLAEARTHGMIIRNPHIEVGAGITLANGIFLESTADYQLHVYNPSFVGAGTISLKFGGGGKFRVYGEEYEGSGFAEASNDDIISFGTTFGGIPGIILTVNEGDAKYTVQPFNITTTGFKLFLWDIDSAELETVDKTIGWYAKYNP